MSPDFNQQIEDYILDRLTKEDRLIFENALAMDETLKNEVAARKLMIKGAKYAGKERLKHRLKNIHEQHNNTRSKGNTQWRWLAGVAAGFVLLLMGSLYLFNQNAFDPQLVYKEYYKASPLHLASRDPENSSKELLKLNELYKNKAYESALPSFNKLLLNDPTNARLKLGKGICHLELDQTTAARDQFLAIIKANDFRLKHNAQWYLALSYLKDGQIEASQTALAPILENSKADHYKVATKLNELLKQEIINRTN